MMDVGRRQRAAPKAMDGAMGGTLKEMSLPTLGNPTRVGFGGLYGPFQPKPAWSSGIKMGLIGCAQRAV